MEAGDLTVYCAGECGQKFEYDGTDRQRWCTACEDARKAELAAVIAEWQRTHNRVGIPFAWPKVRPVPGHGCGQDCECASHQEHALLQIESGMQFIPFPDAMKWDWLDSASFWDEEAEEEFKAGWLEHNRSYRSEADATV